MNVYFVRPMDRFEAVKKIRETGSQRGVGTGFRDLDKLWTMKKGFPLFVAGAPLPCLRRALQSQTSRAWLPHSPRPRQWGLLLRHVPPLCSALARRRLPVPASGAPWRHARAHTLRRSRARLHPRLLLSRPRSRNDLIFIIGFEFRSFTRDRLLRRNLRRNLRWKQCCYR